MFDFHEKRKIKQLVYSKFFIGGLFLLGALIAHSAYERYTVEREMAQKREEKVLELKKLEQRATVLESKISHLKNERGIEEELRSRFDVVKEGEQVVIILDTETPAVKQEELTVSPEDEQLEAKSSVEAFFDMIAFWRP